MRTPTTTANSPNLGDNPEDQALRGPDGRYLPRDNDRDINPRTYQPAG